MTERGDGDSTIPSPTLRSARWFEADDLRSFGHRSRFLQAGLDRGEFMGRPVIGIVNTWSDLNPCHRHLRDRAEAVKRGVWQAGGLPLEIPAMSLNDAIQKPTTMLYRNLLALEVEELLRSNPVDGAVLLGGCDKTTPALVMAATTVDLPAIFVPAGPMISGRLRGTPVAVGTDTWRYWADRRAGLVDDEEWRELETGMARSFGTCMTMGTASTMTSAVDAMGLTLPGASSIPAVDSAHERMAARSGRRVVELVLEDLRPSHILTRAAFEDATCAVVALGGSTNAVIHLVAMARRAGVDFTLRDIDAIAARTPILANIKPVGEFLMDDFHNAGGLCAMLGLIKEHLHLDRPTVGGPTFAATLASAQVFDHDVIRPANRPLRTEGGLAVLFGNLAPRGCVIKTAAASEHLLSHTGPAVVFDSFVEMQDTIDRVDVDIDENSVLVLRNCGPKGAPGMPEWGMMPIPAPLLRRGVRDMVRISDARMSGTSFGTCVLHVSPESAAGGPLSVIVNGDLVRLDVHNRSLDLLISDEEFAARLHDRTPIPQRPTSGYSALYTEHVTQADEGCDFDFASTSPGLVEPEIH